MASLKNVLERYKGICESFVKKTCKTGLIDKGDSVFELPEDYIEIALMKIIKSRGIDEVDIDWSEILQENPIDKSKWVPTLVYIDNDDTLGVRWDKFLAYNTECGCIDVYEDSDTYESFYSQNEQVQTELYREVIDALGMEYVEPKTVYYQTLESFVSKVSRKRGSDLVPDMVYPDGVYILHETLGVRTVEGWNPKDNKGVVGILVVEDDHKIVVALEDSPKKLIWSEERKLVNHPIQDRGDVKSDFNGEKYCRNLNSPEFPAAYYCLNYDKGGRDWYLPSSGELWMIYRHLEEIQNALSIVEGYRLDLDWYWTSSENTYYNAWFLTLNGGGISWDDKIYGNNKVRPVSNFRKKNTLKESFTKKIKSTQKNPLKESFTKKISSKKNTDLISKPSFVLDNGVYILHETLGVKTVEGWNPKDNDGVIGVLIIDPRQNIVVAKNDSPSKLTWSKSKYDGTNREKNVHKTLKRDAAKIDLQGERYAIRLRERIGNYPASDYCLSLRDGGRKWYLPSAGQMFLIYDYINDVQNALIKVGGHPLRTEKLGYWTSTERTFVTSFEFNFGNGQLYNWSVKNTSELFVRPVSTYKNGNLDESFTKKISSKKNTDLISKPSFVPDNGVYILHETLGVKDVEGWNPKDNKGVVGILLIEDDHKIVVALEESPKELHWSKKRELINQPVDDEKDAKSDFNGEEYCRNLNSPDFPAAYYCLNYNKGGRSWYLPSIGELWLIYQHLEEIQTVLSIVEGKKFATTWGDGDYIDIPCYWSSTEGNATRAWGAWSLSLDDINLQNFIKNNHALKVRPISKFQPSELKESFTKKIKSTRKNTLRESFTKKISSKKNTDLVPDLNYPDGVYILHETLGVKSVEGWHKNFNNGVIGILVVEDEHQIVLSLEDSPERFHWSKKRVLVNQPIDLNREDAESDFNGEEYCRNLNSPDFPAAYYCLNYKKGGLDWYLPSAGELWLIYRHLKKIQIALKTVKGKKLVPDYANFLEDAPCYWSSTESNDKYTWVLYLNDGLIRNWGIKVRDNCKVRPVSNFNKNFLKESFTKKISKKTNQELQDDADESILPKNYIELALMSVLCSAKKEGVCFHKPKFHYKDDFGDVYELSEVFLQNDGQEIGGYAQRHYLEIEWNVYENGHMEEEPESSIYPFKDEDDEIKTEIYKRVIEHLGLDYVRPQKKWIEFNDNGFDYFDN